MARKFIKNIDHCRLVCCCCSVVVVVVVEVRVSELCMNMYIYNLPGRQAFTLTRKDQPDTKQTQENRKRRSRFTCCSKTTVCGVVFKARVSDETFHACNLWAWVYLEGKGYYMTCYYRLLHLSDF